MITRRLRKHAAPRDRRAGAAMLVVMLMLLMVTATGVFAIHATSYEIQAAGFASRYMRTQYVGESGVGQTLTWIDVHGPAALRHAMDRSSDLNIATSGRAIDLAPYEPPIAAGRQAHRFYTRDLDTLNIPGVANHDWTTQNAQQAVRSPYSPQLVVDIYDMYMDEANCPTGGRADGGGTLTCIQSTVTARGRLRIPAGSDFVAGDITGQLAPARRSSNGGRAIQLQFHETASDARAFVTAGPIPR